MNASPDRFSHSMNHDPIWVPPIPLELIPNFERMQVTLQVVKRAQEDRRDGMPRASDTDLNPAQEEIRQTAVDAIRRLDGNLMEQLTAASVYMIDDSEEINSAARVRDVEASLSLIIRAEEPLRMFAVDYVAANNERDSFVRKNELNPPAQYQDNLSMLVAVLVVTMIGESCLNALVLKEVNGYGLIGGLGVALLISAVNLALGLAGGVGWRLLCHIRPSQKVIGGLVTAIATMSALGCNLIAAHYRQFAEDSITHQGTVRSALDNALTSGKSTGTAELFASAIPRAEQLEAAVRHLRESGLLGFSSMWSWVLLAAGVGIFFAVCYKSWEDYARYWGYRSRDLRRRRTKDVLDDELSKIEDCAFEYIEEHKKACDKAVTDLEQKASLALRVATQAERRYREMIALVDRWGQTANRLLKVYREENAQPCAPPLPKYWDSYWPAEQYKELVSSESPQPAPSTDCIEPPILTIRSRRKALDRILTNSRRERDEFARITVDLAKGVPARIDNLRAQLLEQARREVAHLFPRRH